MKERIAILKSEMERDYKRLNILFDKFEKSYSEFLGREEYSKLVESAFYVNQIYSGFENIFKNIAGTFENTIEKDYWHKSLLERISLDIQGIRPALVSEESYQCLNELRAFRHFFHHAYGADIDKEKFKIVADKVYRIKGLFGREIERFSAFLDKLME
ncbi:MAG: hypothetical protein AB1611_05420 [bacterium]